MPNFVYSLAGTLTALALSLLTIYQLDRDFRRPAVIVASEPAIGQPDDVMPPRPVGAAAAQFTEFSRADLEVPTIGAYEYEPSAAIKAAATKHLTETRNGRREWYSLAPKG